MPRGAGIRAYRPRWPTLLFSNSLVSLPSSPSSFARASLSSPQPPPGPSQCTTQKTSHRGSSSVVRSAAASRPAGYNPDHTPPQRKPSLFWNPIDAEIFYIVGPALIALILDPIMSLVDTALVGRICGSKALGEKKEAGIPFPFPKKHLRVLRTVQGPGARLYSLNGWQHCCSPLYSTSRLAQSHRCAPDPLRLTSHAPPFSSPPSPSPPPSFPPSPTAAGVGLAGMIWSFLAWLFGGWLSTVTTPKIAALHSQGKTKELSCQVKTCNFSLYKITILPSLRLFRLKSCKLMYGC